MKNKLLYLLFVCLATISYGQNGPIPKYKSNFPTNFSKSETKENRRSNTLGVVEIEKDDSLNLDIKLLVRLKKEIELHIKNIDSEQKKRVEDSTLAKEDLIGYFSETNKSKFNLSNDLVTLQDQIDSINGIISTQKSNRLGFSPFLRSFYSNNKWSLKLFNLKYYGKNNAGFGQNLTLNGSTNLAALTTDLVYGFVGGIRLVLATHINETSNDSSSKSSSDAQKIFNNGGQFSLTAYSPLTFVEKKNGHFHFVKGIMMRVASDLIANGDNNKSAPVLFQVGGDIGIDLLTDEGNIGLFLQVPYAYTFGNNEFYNQRSYNDFFIAQLSGGITLNNQLRIKFTGPLWSTQEDLKGEKYSLGLQLTMPNGTK